MVLLDLGPAANSGATRKLLTTSRFLGRGRSPSTCWPKGTAALWPEAHQACSSEKTVRSGSMSCGCGLSKALSIAMQTPSMYLTRAAWNGKHRTRQDLTKGRSEGGALGRSAARRRICTRAHASEPATTCRRGNCQASAGRQF